MVANHSTQHQSEAIARSVKSSGFLEVRELVIQLKTSPKAVTERLRKLGVPLFGAMLISPGVIPERLGCNDRCFLAG